MLVCGFFFFSSYLFGCARTQLQHGGCSSMTRDQTEAPALGAQSLSHQTTREFPIAVFKTLIQEYFVTEKYINDTSGLFSRWQNERDFISKASSRFKFYNITIPTRRKINTLINIFLNSFFLQVQEKPRSKGRIIHLTIFSVNGILNFSSKNKLKVRFQLSKAKESVKFTLKIHHQKKRKKEIHCQGWTQRLSY